MPKLIQITAVKADGLGGGVTVLYALDSDGGLWVSNNISDPERPSWKKVELPNFPAFVTK